MCVRANLFYTKSTQLCSLLFFLTSIYFAAITSVPQLEKQQSSEFMSRNIISLQSLSQSFSWRVYGKGELNPFLQTFVYFIYIYGMISIHSQWCFSSIIVNIYWFGNGNTFSYCRHKREVLEIYFLTNSNLSDVLAEAPLHSFAVFNFFSYC